MGTRRKIFVSYSHQDRKLFDEFKTMLAPAIQSGLVDLWDDTRIAPGSKWKEEIQEALASASIAVLLVSQNFLASHFITENELPPLLKAAQEEGVTIFWVYLSSCLFEQTEIRSYQAAHDTSRPLDRLPKSQRRAVLRDVCAKLILAMQKIAPPATNHMTATDLRATREQVHAPLKEDDAEQRRWTLPGAPRVFLISAREDRQVVEHLSEQLKSMGIVIWEDKEDLRSGDNWDQACTDVIDRVDYVVVVQTPAMAQRNQGVFYFEIHKALERQQRMKSGVSFLFPVRTGGVAPLPELEHLHSVRLDSDAAVNQLASAIFEDWKRR
jgi:hypothetical protein